MRPGPPDWRQYHDLIRQTLRGDECVVDVGCGDGAVRPFPWERYPRVRLVGLDVDPAAAANPALDEFHRLDARAPWPVEAGAADVVLARYVLEHVAEPETFALNLERALKPGGSFVFLTPNRRHPAMAVSRALPVEWKRRILRRTRGVDESDVFPTFYRMNTPRRLRELFEMAGLRVERLDTREFEPCGYLEFAAPAYALACGWYSLLRRTGLERLLGAQILGVVRKPL